MRLGGQAQKLLELKHPYFLITTLILFTTLSSVHPSLLQTMRCVLRRSYSGNKIAYNK